MSTDSTTTRGRRRDGDRADDRRDRGRGQVILIGAIALAFIVLGVVVVFNGVLYTETLTSAGTGQSASDVDATELEIEQGLGCLLARTDATVSTLDSDDMDAFSDRYENATAHSGPTVVDVSPTGDGDDEVEVRYDSNDVAFTRTLEITAADCPRGVSIDAFTTGNETTDPETEYVYNATWTVSSSNSELSSVNVTLLDDSGDPLDWERTEDFGSDRYQHSATDRLESESEGDAIRIVVENRDEYRDEDEDDGISE